MSTVITLGFGTFGSINLLPTLGFDGGTQPHGVIIRRGKTFLWPDWVEEQKELDRVEKELEALETEQAELLSQLRVSRSQVKLQSERLRLGREIAQEQKRFHAAIAKLNRERREFRERIARQKRMREEFIRIREEQEDEDLRVIAFIVNDLYH